VSGEFERSVRLPDFVDGDRIEASYSHGLLRIEVPKAQAAQPRKIEIRTNASDRAVTAGTN
jgi:HSP20 family protein